MEVIYIGNAFPEEIAKVAIQEHVDVIGVSSLCGSHLTLGLSIIDFLPLGFTLIIGGVFPQEDILKLKARGGFEYVFIPGTTGKEIIDEITDCVAVKRRFYGRGSTQNNC
jgi:methylmalonyl-CoA mutase C-terminal domain/subunit